MREKEPFGNISLYFIKICVIIIAFDYFFIKRYDQRVELAKKKAESKIFEEKKECNRTKKEKNTRIKLENYAFFRC